jgi:hypothetical protein
LGDQNWLQNAKEKDPESMSVKNLSWLDKLSERHSAAKGVVDAAEFYQPADFQPGLGSTYQTTLSSRFDMCSRSAPKTGLKISWLVKFSSVNNSLGR